MKTKLLLLPYLFASISGSFAGAEATPTPVPTPPTNIIINEIEAAVASGFFEVSFNPTYAPKLAKQWGGEFTIDHPIGDYAFVGVNLMALNGGYFAGTVGIGAKASFPIGKVVVTPYVSVGAFKPFQTGNAKSGSTADSTSVGASASTGASVLFYQTKDKKIDISGYGGIEYVSIYPGFQIYQIGGKIGYHFW